MNIAQPSVSQKQVQEALEQYKTLRSLYDSRDWQVKKIYWAIPELEYDRIISHVRAWAA